jgi:FSR family fosmidomycin resistance protein-like MFS transporter
VAILEVIGPLLVAIIVAPYGQSNIILCTVGILGIFVLTKIAVWYQNHLNLRAAKNNHDEEILSFSKRKIQISIGGIAFNFSKFFYMSSMSSYFTFYLMQKFGLSIQESQFVCFLSAAVAGNIWWTIRDRFEGNTSFGFQFWEQLPLLCFCLTLICLDWNIISGYRIVIARHFRPF